LADGLEIIDGEWDFGFTGNRQQMEDGVGGTPCTSHGCNSIFEGGTSENVARAEALLQGIHNHCAATERDLILARVHGRNTVEAHGREANEFHDGGHGVGGVLAATGPGAGTSYIFEFEQILVAHLASRVGTHSFEYVLDGDIFAAILARGDGAAVQHEPGNVKSRECHGSGRNRLVTSHHTNYGIEELAATDQFDRVGDDFAAHE